MYNRRTLIKSLGMAAIGAAVIPITATAKPKHMYLGGCLGMVIGCDICNRVVPEHLVILRDPKPNTFGNYSGTADSFDNQHWWWDRAIGTQYQVACLDCINHKICFPYFEQIYFTNPDMRPFGSTLEDYQGSGFITSLRAANHECCIEKELEQLHRFFDIGAK